MKKTMNGGDFDVKLAELQAKYEAEPTGMNDIEIGCLYCKFADKLTRKFVDAIKTAPTIDEMLAKSLRAGILVTKQKGKVVFIGYKTLAQYTISGNFHRFTFQHNSSRLAEYDTPEQVEAVINSLKAAIERRDTKFTFPTIDELTTPAEIDADEYAISEEAFNVAIDAEIEQAANAVVEVSEEPKTTSKIDADVAEYQAKFDGAVADSNVDDSATLTINGERIEFGEGKLNKIVAPKLDAEITFGNGKKTFHYRGTVQSKAEFFKRLDELADIRAQIAAVENFKKTHGACMITAHCDFRAPFVAIVHVVIKSGEQSREKHFAGDFLTFDGAKKFVDDFKTFAGEMKFFAAIKRDSTNGEECYKRDFDGNETVAEEFTIPNAATSETKEELREKASELADLKERLDKEKSFAECSRDHLKTGQTWMRAATEKSDGAEFYKAQIAATNATIAKLNERIADLKAQITAVENELETVNKKIATAKKAA